MPQREQELKVPPAVPDRRAIYRAPDAKLLELVSAGNPAAYDILFSRHVEAAHWLANIMVTPAEADHVVAEAFAEVRDATLLGNGPSDAFRPYVLTVLRRVSGGLPPADTMELPDAADPAGDPDEAELGMLPIVRAFRSLPERWIAVLWHTQIEETTATDLTRILGISLIGVAALRSRALEGLREAYLQVHMSDVADADCQQAARRLAAFFWGTASRRDKTIVTKHLGRCDQCRAMYAEFTDIEGALRSVVAPALLGSAAPAYMYAAHRAAARAGGKGIAATQTEPAEVTIPGDTEVSAATVSAATVAGSLRPPGLSRFSSRRLRLIGAGTVAALAVAAVALLAVAARNVLFTSAHHGLHVGAAAPATPAPSAQPSRPPQTKTLPPSPPPSPAPAATHSAAPAANPVAPPATAAIAPAPAHLSATVSVQASGSGFNGETGQNDQVTFTVADNGGSATGQITVSLSLPGSSLATPTQDSGGWNCQQAGAGRATCQHAGIQSGTRVAGSLLISVSDPQEACGRTVSLTAVSGNASDTAQSPEGIECGR